MMDERTGRIEARINLLENRQEDICERIKNCAGGKR
jgi:chaperonin cofactor prefoldin